MNNKVAVLRLEDVPEGHWVVLSADDDRVVAHHKDLRTVLELGEKSGEQNLEFMRAINLGMHMVACVRCR